MLRNFPRYFLLGTGIALVLFVGAVALTSTKSHSTIIEPSPMGEWLDALNAYVPYVWIKGGTTGIDQTTPGTTNAVYDTTVEPCADQTNLACRTFGGPVRVQQMVGTGYIPSTASDATSAVFLIPTGMKTFQGVVTCSTTCVQTQIIYGGYSTTFNAATFDPVCINTLNRASSDHATCKTDLNYTHWFVVTSGSSGGTLLSMLNVYY